MRVNQNRQPSKEQGPKSQLKKPTKKDQIISLYLGGITEMEEIARITRARMSYVASVLQGVGLISGYFDLYTSTNQPINAYSRFFASRLGFRDEEVARQSVSLIDRMYKMFASNGDRAGQHHALMMALTMFDRARWTNKQPEAEVFRDWLMKRLEEVGELEEETPPSE